jgi:hypothetical protein
MDKNCGDKKETCLYGQGDRGICNKCGGLHYVPWKLDNKREHCSRDCYLIEMAAKVCRHYDYGNCNNTPFDPSQCAIRHETNKATK